LLVRRAARRREAWLSGGAVGEGPLAERWEDSWERRALATLELEEVVEELGSGETEPAGEGEEGFFLSFLSILAV
jgi:hypothetical protein